MNAIANLNRQAAAPYHGAGDVVRSASGGFAILHGALAPEGCVARIDAFEETVFDGPARVFESSADAISGIAAGRVRSCDILIVRGDEGFDADSLQAALSDAGLERVTLITDASARDASGAVIGHVAPSAAARGPIAYVNDDDIIHIDLTAGRIDVLADIDLRRGVRTQKPGKAVFGAGALQKYARLVTAAHK